MWTLNLAPSQEQQVLLRLSHLSSPRRGSLLDSVPSPKLISFLDVNFFYKTDLRASLVPAVSRNNQLKICQWSTIFGDGIFWSPAVIFGVASSESQHIPPLCIPTVSPGTLRAIGSKPCLSSAVVAPSGG